MRITQPMISIIIATYNAGIYLQLCLDSIAVQRNENVELIIIDGGSTDNTIEIIAKNREQINYWISEPDRGIYDAWNKGLQVVNGDWIMFLGADDQLVPDAIESYTTLIKSIYADNQVDFISSKVQMIDENGKEIRIKGWSFSWPLFLKEMTVAHTGALHSKMLFQKYGQFNTDFKIVGDYEFLLRSGDSLNALFMNKVTVIMSENGASDSVKAIREHYKAVTFTGKYSKYKALMNAITVYLKFKIKKLARNIGLNLYLRKQ
jgi:glycosyltransferase involved in cell wall biosynthesis